MTFQEYMASPRGGIGFGIAFIVLVICIILAFIGQVLTPLEVLGLIGALALARLL